MVIGSKYQLKSWNLDDFKNSVDSDKQRLATQANYFGLWVSNDLSWDDHFLELQENVSLFSHVWSTKNNHPIFFTS